MKQLTGAQILMKTLIDEGVETIFGYPGGAVIDIYDELVKTKIKHILVRHEQAAVHAADAYSRAKGKTGVCLVTSGPGATNTVTGIASAYMDSIPMVVITGQVPTQLIGNDAFQEVDIVGITRPCTKHNYLVKSTDDLAQIIKEAFYIAASGRPGPVLIDIPKNVANGLATYKAPKEIKMRSYNPTYKPNMKQLQKVVDLIRDAKRPMVFAGGGAILSGASKELTQFVKKTKMPITTSLMGLGVYPGDDPLSLGMLGMHGTYRANMSTGKCDLMIAIGVRFDDRVTGKTDVFASQAKIVHIDIDPTSIRKNVPVTIPIVGDCNETLIHLNKLIMDADLGNLTQKRKTWLDQIADWKSTTPLAYKQTKNVIKPQYVVEKIYELTKGDAIITTEVGQNQMWAAQYYHFKKPNHFITSGGLGVMGFGLPAAIGAQIACPNKTVIDIAGDGSIQMNIQELATAVQFNLPVKIAILNNRYLGMVRQWQELFYDKRYASTEMVHAPDFVKLAEAFGAEGLRATKPEEVETVLKKGLASKKTVIMEFIVDREESVYPMVPAGAAITDMLLV
ncbi:MAG: biosynthetic-type acetolactate synthase large subunit [Desulfobacterales bacterium]|nr:biosynthetic-type acetolactate synthase large subunit [Desulfobacterales bacterium]